MIKKSISILIITTLFLFASCGASKKTVYKRPVAKKTAYKRPVTKKREAKVSSRPKTVQKSKNTNPTIADKVIWSAVSYKGTPYKYAGITKKGMDCSGLIYTSFKERDIILPRSSGLQYKEGHKISLKQARRGDLLFFKTTQKNKSKVNHVGLVTSVVNGVVNFIHSSSSRGVVINSMSESYYKNAFVEAKRVL